MCLHVLQWRWHWVGREHKTPIEFERWVYVFFCVFVFTLIALGEILIVTGMSLTGSERKAKAKVKAAASR